MPGSSIAGRCTIPARLTRALLVFPRVTVPLRFECFANHVFDVRYPDFCKGSGLKRWLIHNAGLIVYLRCARSITAQTRTTVEDTRIGSR